MTESQAAELYRMQVRELRDFAVFMADTKGIVKTWNAGVEHLLGYSENEWIGLHASIIFTPAEKAQDVCESEMQKAAEQGSVTDIRWHRRKNQTEFFANGVMNAIRDDRGELVGFAKIISDETARKRLQDSLTESNAALEQFAYVASHDLQEPLRTMCNYAQLLNRQYKGKLDPNADEILGFIVGAANRMSALVRDLLTYARATTEQERPSSVRLDEDIESALTLLGQAIQESGGTVTHDPLPTVQVDRGQMVRLFQNLVANALKYHRPGVPPKVHIASELLGTEWLISIHDEGIGFEPRYAAEIFAPFKRLHTADEYPGSGVGLAICKRIVQAHGGRIWAESQPEGGTTFFFTLPVEGRPPLQHTPPVDAGLPSPLPRL